MNEIILYDGENLESIESALLSMPTEIAEGLLQKVINKRTLEQLKLHDTRITNVEDVTSRVVQRQVEQDKELNEIRNLTIEDLKKEVFRQEIEKDKEYQSLTDIGRTFHTTISAQKVGMLLRLIGWARKSIDKTIPYRHIERNGAIPKVKEYSDKKNGRMITWYQWHIKQFKDTLEIWLTDNGYYLKFLTIMQEKPNSPNELEDYISFLHKKYVEDLRSKLDFYDSE